MQPSKWHKLINSSHCPKWNRRWVNLWSERWANLLYCCMIFKPFPFPAMKELSEVHLLHFPRLCSIRDNYFSALPFQNKYIFLLGEGRSRKIHFPSWILCLGGGLQQCASWAWVIPVGWSHTPGWFRLPTMSLHRSFSFPSDYRETISNQDPDQGDSVTGKPKGAES